MSYSISPEGQNSAECFSTEALQRKVEQANNAELRKRMDAMCIADTQAELQRRTDAVVRAKTRAEVDEAMGMLPSPVDNVNSPAHYASGSVECIDAIEAQLTPEEFRGYLKGNIAKYVWREKSKGGAESLKKAQWYLNRLVK